MPDLYVYVYFLGLWLIGPFVSLGDCERARQYQIDFGGALHETVSRCYQYDRAEWERSPASFSIVGPTYGAPLTPGEYARRHGDFSE